MSTNPVVLVVQVILKHNLCISENLSLQRLLHNTFEISKGIGQGHNVIDLDIIWNSMISIKVWKIKFFVFHS